MTRMETLAIVLLIILSLYLGLRIGDPPPWQDHRLRICSTCEYATKKLDKVCPVCNKEMVISEFESYDAYFADWMGRIKHVGHKITYPMPLLADELNKSS